VSWAWVSVEAGELGSGQMLTAMSVPMAAPITWATMKAGAELGAIPAQVPVSVLPMVTAGLAEQQQERLAIRRVSFVMSRG
jgi:hypothetical protein